MVLQCKRLEYKPQKPEQRGTYDIRSKVKSVFLSKDLQSPEVPRKHALLLLLISDKRLVTYIAVLRFLSDDELKFRKTS